MGSDRGWLEEAMTVPAEEVKPSYDTLNVRIQKSLLRKVKVWAVMHDMKLQDAVESLLIAGGIWGAKND